MEVEEVRRMLVGWEDHILTDMLAGIPKAQISNFIAAATNDFRWYLNKSDNLTFPQQQAIMSIVSIRATLSMFPPRRALPMQEDAQIATIAALAFNGGMMAGMCFPERLRAKHRPLVEKGLKFIEGPKRPRRDALQRVIEKAFDDCQSKTGSPPQYQDVLDCLRRLIEIDSQVKNIVDDIDEDGTVYWRSAKGIDKVTSLGKIKDRLTRIRKARF